MDPRKDDTSTAPTGHGIPIVHINGERVRNIREEKGLTQLYLSEVVGVTTDTISRWENRRYPSIKLENARNLARALEVDLEAILEQKENRSAVETELPPAAAGKKIQPRMLISLALIILLVIIISGLAVRYYSPPGQPAPVVSARRILPPHVPPGQVFPVLIRVENPAGTSIALILKETIPPGTAIEYGVPFFTTVDPENNELKWISRTADNRIIFAYLARAPRENEDSSPLVFDGSITLKQKSGSNDKIAGDSSLAIAPYHWADSNRDKMIDDEEILAVYDLYSDMQELGLDRDLIDEVWAGSGYRWDDREKKYIVLD